MECVETAGQMADTKREFLSVYKHTSERGEILNKGNYIFSGVTYIQIQYYSYLVYFCSVNENSSKTE